MAAVVVMVRRAALVLLVQPVPVARVVQIEKQVGSSFMRIRARPVARVDGALHVLVLAPAADAPPSPLAAPATGAAPGGDAPVKGGAP